MKIQLLFAACLLLVFSTGCQPTSQDTGDTPAAASGAEDGGAHAGHNHGDVGPHGGHLLHLEPSGAHAEWAHDDDTHQITVYLDDFDADKITGAKFVAKIGDAVEEFPLVAGDEGWTVTSEALMTHINMGEAVEVSLVVGDDSGEQTTAIEAHEHHHH